MFKENSTAKIIEYIQSLPAKKQRVILETISTKTQKKERKTSSITEQAVLNNIKIGLLEIKEAKKTGKKLKTLDQFLNEL